MAVADVKEFRLNAKREHLRSRIGVVLGFQAYLGALCETISLINIRLFQNEKWLNFLEKLNLIPIKYQLKKLDMRSYPVRIPHHIGTSQNSFNGIDEIYPETGFYIHNKTLQNNFLFETDENTRLSNETNDLKDVLEESNIRVNNELRKAVLILQNELEDIKRQLMR